MLCVFNFLMNPEETSHTAHGCYCLTILSSFHVGDEIYSTQKNLRENIRIKQLYTYASVTNRRNGFRNKSTKNIVAS